MYSHVAPMAPDESPFIAGQVLIDAKGFPVASSTLPRRSSMVFENLGKILADLGTDFEPVVQFNTLPDRAAIPSRPGSKPPSALFHKLFPGGKYPPITLIVIDRLGRTEFLMSRCHRRCRGAGIIPCLPWQIDLGLLHVCQLRCEVTSVKYDRSWKANDETPSGASASLGDIASRVCFLASPLAGEITGTVIAVDGGLRRYRF